MIDGLLNRSQYTTANPEWWKNAVVYQIYPRSFADADGDGVGDLRGVTSKLDYLQQLGIDAIWMSPFYPSPLADGGYDVADYCDVDPRLGSIDDFRALVEGAHLRGIRMLVDIVPNHTSSAHPWFKAALEAAPGSAERDRYLFRDGNGNEPPSDWRSHFGGSAWSRTGDGQWYLHLFDAAQPDLNWANPEVRSYFEDVLRFWADLGVDGFRIDVAHSLAKDLSEPLRSQPNIDAALPLDGTDPLYDREEVHEIYRSWRRVFDEYDPPRMAVAETWSPGNARTYLYARRDELGQVFDFSLLKSEWGLASYRGTIQRSLDSRRSLDGDIAGMTWVLSSHDVPRHASRLAVPEGITPDEWLLGHGQHPAFDSGAGLRRAKAATLMMLALPGSAYLYQGEELGLREVAELPIAVLQDPVWQRSHGSLKGRDGCRVPLPWTVDGDSFGFGGSPWLPQPDDWGRFSVQAQSADPESTLTLYRTALRLRHELAALRGFDFAWQEASGESLRFSRGADFRCVVNFSKSPISLDLATGESVALATAPLLGGELPPESTAWIAVHSSSLD